MADNVQITAGVGTFISADSVTRVVADERMQIIKIGLGADGVFQSFTQAGAIAESLGLAITRTSDAAVYETLTKIAFGSVGAGFALALSPGGDLRYLEIQNDTDAAIEVSFDAGSTAHWQIPLKEPRIFDYNAFGRFQSADIHIRHAGVAPTSGEVRIMAYR